MDVKDVGWDLGHQIGCRSLEGKGEGPGRKKPAMNMTIRAAICAGAKMCSLCS